MNATHTFKVGDEALHVERIPFASAGAPRLICRVRIVRETATLWIDDGGTRYRKSDGAMYPQYVSPRYLVPTTTETR